MNFTALKKALGLQRIVGLDFETYWDSSGYTLSKMSTTDYVTDPRFMTHMVAVCWTRGRSHGS